MTAIQPTAKVAFVTEIDFWRVGTGGRVRSYQLIKHLCDKTDLTVILIRPPDPSDAALIKRLNLSMKVVWVSCRDRSTLEKLSLFNAAIKGMDFNIAIIQSWGNSLFREVFPDRVATFIDVDDLLSEVYETCEKNNIDYEYKLSLSDECSVYNNFDRVILIQKEHVKKVALYCAPDKIIYTPPHIPSHKIPVRQQVKSIGLVASHCYPNLHGIQWFFDTVFGLVDWKNISFDLYGTICGEIKSVPHRRVRLIGYIGDLKLAYGNMDVVINPVRIGSGIKIKTLEALAHGVPAVVTQEGARGLQYLKDKSFLMADSGVEFADAVNQLVQNYEMRKSLGDEGWSYVHKNHDIESCYAELMNSINELV